MYYSENLIPTMTSDTTPSGIAKASSVYNSSFKAYYAFDNNFKNNWITLSGQKSGWISYTFAVPQKVGKYAITPNNLSEAPNTWTFEGSNDEVVWDVLDSQSNIVFSTSEKKEFIINNNKTYKTYRLNISINNGASRLGFAELEMFKLIYDDRFLIKLNNDKIYSLIIPDQNKDLIPKMTSENAPSGVVTTSSILHSNYAWQAFDDVTTGNGWMASSPMNEWICYQFPQRKRVGKYTLMVTYTASSSPKDWTFEGSNDGQNWVVLDTRTGVIDWVSGVKKEFYIEKSKIEYFSYYRVNISTNVNGGYISIGEIEMMETEISLINAPNSAEESFIKYGLNNNMEIDLMTEINIEKFIQNQSEPLGLGKIFRKKIDTSKTPFKIEIL